MVILQIPLLQMVLVMLVAMLLIILLVFGNLGYGNNPGGVDYGTQFASQNMPSSAQAMVVSLDDMGYYNSSCGDSAFGIQTPQSHGIQTPQLS